MASRGNASFGTSQWLGGCLAAPRFEKFCSLWLKSEFNSNMILCLQIKQGSYTKRLMLLTRTNVIILSIGTVTYSFV